MTLTATTADMTVTATVEMAVPTNLGDLTVVQPPTDAITEGRDAWIRIKTASKMMREDWRKVGEALLIGRRKFTNERGGLNKKGFGQWCKAEGFGDIDARVRSDALWVVDHWVSIFQVLEDRPDACHPTHIRAAYNDALNGKATVEEEDDDTPSLPSPTSTATAPHTNPTPSISAPAPSKDEEDDLPFDPSPNGEPTFVQSNPSPAPAVEGNDEEEEDVQRKRGRLYAADLITDPEQKMRMKLTSVPEIRRLGISETPQV